MKGLHAQKLIFIYCMCIPMYTHIYSCIRYDLFPSEHGSFLIFPSWKPHIFNSKFAVWIVSLQKSDYFSFLTPGSISSCDAFLNVFQSKGLRQEVICPCASSPEALTVAIRRYRVTLVETDPLYIICGNLKRNAKCIQGWISQLNSWITF